MNLSNTGLVTSARQDAVYRQLSASAKGISLGISMTDFTSRAKTSNHETDKQSEDNATWFFEYRALLNSKLTTLTTSLTSAYTTDLDASMGAQNALWPGKNAMQGITGQLDASGTTIVDPGAARTAYAYFSNFSNVIDTTRMQCSSTWNGTTIVPAAIGASATLTYGVPAGSPTIVGSTTFMSGGDEKFILDSLTVNFSNPGAAVDPADPNWNPLSIGNRYSTTKVASYVEPVNPGLKWQHQVGNNLELTLYKFFVKPENLDILRFGLLDNVFIVGTSSLPTGSQVQGSIKLNWDLNAGQVVLSQERYAAFFHS